jgi:hypothetical protein
MLVQLIIELLVMLLGIYYFTIFLQFVGVPIFKTEVCFTKAFIPFFYWVKGWPKPAEKPVVEVPAEPVKTEPEPVKTEPVKKPTAKRVKKT